VPFTQVLSLQLKTVLAFAQQPRVGISGLLLDAAVIDNLHTEKELNMVTNVHDDTTTINATKRAIAGLNNNDGGLVNTVEVSLRKGKRPAGMTDDTDSELMVHFDPLSVGELGGDSKTIVDLPHQRQSKRAKKQTEKGKAFSQKIDNDDEIEIIAATTPRPTQTTNDKEAWEELQATSTWELHFKSDQEYHAQDGLTIGYIQKEMRLMWKCTVMWNVEGRDPSDIRSFVPAYLVKISKELYEVMDDYEDICFASLTMGGPDGVESLWGKDMKPPTFEFVEHCKDNNLFSDGAHSRKIEGVEHDVTPRRKASREQAAKHMETSAKKV